MVPLVAVSGVECVEALVCAGFTVRSRDDDAASLVNTLRSVTVPLVAMLTPEELTNILRDAGVSYSDFLEYLSETPTEPDVHHARARRPARAV